MVSWGLILAGGESRRMGSEKALIMWRGESLISHTVNAMRDSGIESILIAIPDEGDRTEEVMASAGEGVVQSSDDVRFKGPIAGLAGAVSLLQKKGVGWVQLSPCDTPALSSDVYLMLKNTALKLDKSVVPVDSTGAQWLHALVKVDGLAEGIENAARGEDWGRAIHRLLEGIGWHPLSEESLAGLSTGFHNVNSPADLKSLM